MSIGSSMRQLRRHKVGAAISIALAALAALWSIDRISLFPPRLAPRSLEMATAHAQALIDTPSSGTIDLRWNTYSVTDLHNRAIVLGNVVASASVEARIAQRAHIPPGLLRIQAPLTPQQSSPPVDSQNARHVSDILKSTDQYRIEVDANPTVPMLDLYAQTPTATSAAALANAAVDELKAYVTRLAASQKTPERDQIRLVQLGRATGAVINHGVKWQLAIIVFVLTLGLSCATVLLLARVRIGWRQAALSERAAGT